MTINHQSIEIFVSVALKLEFCNCCVALVKVVLRISEASGEASDANPNGKMADDDKIFPPESWARSWRRGSSYKSQNVNS